jgi:hypothetical protein
VRRCIGRTALEEPDHRHRRLLRPRRERPCSERASEQRDELASAAHSITSSARASSVGVTSTPRAFAVLRLRADCVAKVFLTFGRETLIQDRARTSNNDSKEPTLRFDCYKFPFHRACLATFATQSARIGLSTLKLSAEIFTGAAMWGRANWEM